MLTNLQIENFKGWKDTGKLRWALSLVIFLDEALAEAQYNHHLAGTHA